MPKSPEKSGGAFRTIREVADWLGVPTHVLRFWESKFEQIAPVKGAGGRRYYRPEDMRLLGGIKVMLHDDGLTIRAVAQRIEEQGVEPIMALSPELEAGESNPPQRTRRVIRKGDDDTPRPEETRAEEPEPSAPVTASDSPEDAASPETPADDDPGGPPVAIAKEPATPLAETLPDQPDAPELPAEAPDPGDPLPEAPRPQPSETPLDRAAPDEPATEPDSAPSDPPHQVRHAPEPEDATPTAPAGHAAPSDGDPLTRARGLALSARRLSPPDRKRLRRIVRRYRALAEEIADDLSEESSN